MSMETKRPGPEGQRTPEENYEHSDADVRALARHADRAGAGTGLS